VRLLERVGALSLLPRLQSYLQQWRLKNNLPILKKSCHIG
jgi:hypothetical protein